MQLYFDDVSDDPDQIARARRAPEAEAVLEGLGFQRLGFVRHRLRHFGHPPMHPGLRDEVLAVWRDAEKTTLAWVDRAWESDSVMLYSLSADGHQVKTAWQQDDAIEPGLYATYDPAGPRPDLTEDDLTRRVTVGREAVVEAFDLPTARIHTQDALGGSLAEAVDLHGHRCRKVTEASWMPMPVTGSGILENRMVRAAPTSPVFRRALRGGLSTIAMLFIGGLLTPVGLQIAVWLAEDPEQLGIAGLWSGMAPGFGVMLGAWVHQQRTARRTIPGASLSPSWSAVLLPLLVAGWTLYVLVSEPRMLAVSAVALLVTGGAVGVFGSAEMERRRAERDDEVKPAWDGLDGARVLAEFGSAESDGPSTHRDPLGLLEQGWTRAGQTEWGSRAPAFSILGFIRFSFISGTLPEPAPVPIEVFVRPDRRVAARVVVVDGATFVSLISRRRDGTWIETRSLPDPGPGTYYTGSSILSASEWRRRRWWPSDTAVNVSSHPAMGLRVDHVEGATDALAVHLAREDVHHAEPLVEPQHVWAALRPLRPSVPFVMPLALLPMVSWALAAALVYGAAVGGEWGRLVVQGWLGSIIGWGLTASGEKNLKTILLGWGIAVFFAWPADASTMTASAVAIGAGSVLYTLWTIGERIPHVLAVRRSDPQET